MKNKKIICFDHFGIKREFYENEYIDREAVYGIYTTNNRILLVQDVKSKQWEIPGGGKTESETDKECLSREFTEETGLVILGPIKFLNKFNSYFYDIDSQIPWNTLRKFYLVSKTKGKLKKNGNGVDIQSAKYIPLETISSLKMDVKIKELVESL